MYTSPVRRIGLALVVLMLAMMACSINIGTDNPQPTSPPPQPVPPTNTIAPPTAPPPPPPINTVPPTEPPPVVTTPAIVLPSPTKGIPPQPTTPVPPPPPPVGNIQFTSNGWSETLNNGCPVNPQTSFPTGIKSLWLSFKYQGMEGQTKVRNVWYLNGESQIDKQFDWDGGPQGECYSYGLDFTPDSIPEGHFTLELYTGPNQQLILRAETDIGGAPPPQPTGGVILQGQVVDANTSQGVEGIGVVILNPGVNPDTWISNPNTADIFTGKITGKNGYFEIPDRLQRNVEYGAVVGNPKLGYPSVTGKITLPNDAPDPAFMTIQISK